MGCGVEQNKVLKKKMLKRDHIINMTYNLQLSSIFHNVTITTIITNGKLFSFIFYIVFNLGFFIFIFHCYILFNLT